MDKWNGGWVDSDNFNDHDKHNHYDQYLFVFLNKHYHTVSNSFQRSITYLQKYYKTCIVKITYHDNM